VLVPDGCSVHTLATESDDSALALRALADALGAKDPADLQPASVPPAPTGGRVDPSVLAAAIAATMPERAIVVDEGQYGRVRRPDGVRRAAILTTGCV